MLIHFSLTLILVILNLLPVTTKFRKMWILPLSFLAIGLFMGFRYDYGLDYWNYYRAFYSNEDHGTDEILFWMFFYFFDKYYVFILVKSLLLAFILFYLVRKYVPEKFYWLFIFFFMLNGSLIYTMITAERTCVGAMVLWVGMEFFYFRKKHFVLLIGVILVASLFHTILLSMIVIPLIDLLYAKLKIGPSVIIPILLISLVIGSTITPLLFQTTINNIEAFGKYEYYTGTHRFTNSNIVGAMFKALMLFPVYFIIKPSKHVAKNDVYLKFVVLTLCYMLVYFMGFETDGRIGMILLPFFVIAMTEMLSDMKMGISPLLIIVPFLVITLFNDYSMYSRMISEPWLEGNYLTYQTIFDVSFYE